MSVSSRGESTRFAPVLPEFLRNVFSSNLYNHGQGIINKNAKFNPDSLNNKLDPKKLKMNFKLSVNQPTVMDIQISNNETISNNFSDNIATT